VYRDIKGGIKRDAGIGKCMTCQRGFGEMGERMKYR